MGHVGIVAGVLDDAGRGADRRPATGGARAKLGRSPLGRVISTGSGNSPVSSAVKAAFAAAVAQAPVVQPRRKGPRGFSRMSIFLKAGSRFD